jgi:ElaA protein
MIRVEQTDDLATCRTLRRVVFIDEQNVPEAEEWDGRDGEALHLLAFDGATPIGTARLFDKGATGKIGRVCVLASARGRGIGAALIRAGEALLAEQGCTRAMLGAQCHAIPFYEGLGFTAFGPIYDDAGIPHRDMDKPL